MNFCGLRYLKNLEKINVTLLPVKVSSRPCPARRSWPHDLPTPPGGSKYYPSRIFAITHELRKLSTQNFQYLLLHQLDRGCAYFGEIRRNILEKMAALSHHRARFLGKIRPIFKQPLLLHLTLALRASSNMLTGGPQPPQWSRWPPQWIQNFVTGGAE